MEKYIELYKKYRPKRWRELIGQQTQARSIQKAILAKKVPTAYLFSGPRGCGKTSAALLTAKAINCLNLNPKNADPCNECEVCVSINEGTQMGITYISAAQMKGVDEVRDLVQKARMQTSLKQQVFIIDEIHNLKSGGGKGFEALLIPLEEEDMPSLFIFCTTEIEKVPKTILSRVQSRKFNLVGPEDMEAYLSKILENENQKLDADSLSSVVRMGRGSVRDTITKLEEVLSGSGVTPTFGGELLEAIAAKSVPAAWKAIAEAEANGIDARSLGEQLFEDLRDLALIATDPQTELASPPPVDSVDSIIKGCVGVPGLIRAANEIGEGLSKITWGGDPRINLEFSVAKAIRALRAADAKRNGRKGD